LSLFPIGALVELSDGRQARVLRRNGNNYSSPIVQIVADADGVPISPLDHPEGLDPAERNLKSSRYSPTPLLRITRAGVAETEGLANLSQAGEPAAFRCG